MMEIGAWRAHNDAYLGTALRWLRSRLSTLADPDVHDASAEEAIEREMREAETSEPPPALLLLAHAFSLTPFERSVLLLCAAPALDTGMPALFARAQGDPARGYPTFALAMALFADPEWEAMSVGRPLRYWRLVEPAPREATAITVLPLAADERIVHFIKGLNAMDARLLPLLTPAPPTPALAPSQEELAGRIAAQHRSVRSRLVQLVGANRASGLAVATGAARQLRLALQVLAPESLSQPLVDADTFVRLWERESRILPLALYIDLGDQTPSPQQVATLRRLGVSDADVERAPVFLGLRETARELASDSLLFDVDTPTAAEQRALWTEEIGEDACGAPERLSAHFDFDATEIARIAAVASAETGGGLCDRLWRDSVAFGRPRLSGLAERIEPRATWNDIVLPAETMRLLREIADQVRHRHQVYDAWGWRARMSRGLGVTALFAGESGTGKTMAAEVLASDLRLDLYRIDLSSIVSKYIGETEKNLRAVFDAAEHGGALLFFDEADALFGKRSEIKDSHDRYANIEVSYLLQRMEAYDGIVILATNFRTNLDVAFVRRIRFIVPFPFPGPAERRAIWERAFPPETPVDALDVEKLARLNLNGAAIHSIALNAAFLAAARRSAVDLAVLKEATRMELRKRDRPTSEAESL